MCIRDSEKTALQTSVADQREFLITLRQELEQQKKAVTEEQKAVAAAEKKFNSQLELLQTKNQKLQTQVDSDKQRHIELVAESKKIIKAKRGLEKDLASSQKSAASQVEYAKEIKALKKDRKQGLSELTQALKRFEALEKQSHILKSQNGELLAKQKVANRKLKDVGKSGEKSAKRLAKLEKAKEKAEASAAQRKSQLKALKAELASRIKEKNGIISKLKKDAAKAKTKAKTKSTTKVKAKAKTKAVSKKAKRKAKPKSTTVRSSAVASIARKSKAATKKKSKTTKAKRKPTKSTVVRSKTSTVTKSTTKKRDNLTRIEGIGPKIQQVMRNAGVDTFAKMAGSNPKKLAKILAKVDLQMHTPDTWPQQARLAADGDWKQLEKLQDRLDGGRKASAKSKAAKTKSSSTKSSAKKSSAAKHKTAQSSSSGSSSAKAKTASKTGTASSPDDLTRIEGIGPKIKQLLNKDGIHSFADLATAAPSRLEKILDAAGTRFNTAVPDTWPNQSDLAAKGEWEKLEKLQDELDAGR